MIHRPHEKARHPEDEREAQQRAFVIRRPTAKYRSMGGGFTIAAVKYSKGQRNRIHNTRTGHFGVDL